MNQPAEIRIYHMCDAEVIKEKARNLEDTIRYTYNWNKHKRQFSERQIKLATKRLADKGWIPIFSGEFI